MEDFVDMKSRGVSSANQRHLHDVTVAEKNGLTLKKERIITSQDMILQWKNTRGFFNCRMGFVRFAISPTATSTPKRKSKEDFILTIVTQVNKLGDFYVIIAMRG